MYTSVNFGKCIQSCSCHHGHNIKTFLHAFEVNLLSPITPDSHASVFGFALSRMSHK